MKCSYCTRRLSAEAPRVVILINGDSTQAYCGTPQPAGGADGLSCWQRAIQAWNSLIEFEKDAPNMPTESRVLRVRRQKEGKLYAEAQVELKQPPDSTVISRKRHKQYSH
jgi:hypothetical protein